MADNDFVRRSMQIVGRGFVQSTTNYFDNAISFVNDTKEIIDMGVDTAKNAFTKYNDMRNTGVGKKFRDWFYNEGGMFGDFDFGDDDFDAGFDIDSADDNVKESAQPLTSDQLESVSKKQTGAIYKALGKNADLHMANTAEIVSAINGRSAELTASVNNLNNTLVQIGKRLDLIVEYTAGRMKKPGYESSTEKSIFDYNGQISVSSLKDVIKEAMEDSLTGSMLSIVGNMKDMITPESIASMAFSGLFERIRFTKGPLAGKSIDNIGTFINESIGQAITDGFTKLLTSKNDVLSMLFSDIVEGTSKKNFQSYAKNQYNDKPAVFDGMTRKSIITVIPGYLNEILKAVNGGKGKNIDNKGNLTDKSADHFTKAVSNAMFGYVDIDWDKREATYRSTRQAFGDNIDRALISKVYETLQTAWLFWMYEHGKKLLEIGQVTNLSHPSTLEVIATAMRLLENDKSLKVSHSELTHIVPFVLQSMDERKFRNTLHAKYKDFYNACENFAKNDVHGYQADKITIERLLDASTVYNNRWSSSSSTVNNSQIGGAARPNILGINDYLHGIYSILNRGINVYVTGTGTSQTGPYNSITIQPHIGETSNVKPSSPVVKVASNASLMSDLYGPAPTPTTIGSFSTTSSGGGETADSYKEQRYVELKAHEDELTPAEKRELETLSKDMSAQKRASLRSRVVERVKNHRKLKGFTIGLNPLVDKVNEYAPGVGDRIGQVGNRVMNAVNGAIGHADNALFGQEVALDANGNPIRVGGFVDQAGVKIRGAAGRAADYGANLLPTRVLQRRTDNLFNSVASRDVAEMTHDQIDDQQTMQLIQQEMPLVMSNGAVDEEELNALMTNVRAIKDPELKRQINRTLIPLLRRNKVKVGDVNAKSDGGAKTTLGKILSTGFGVLGMIFKPVLTYIKYVGGALLLSFKKISGKILKVATWGFRTGAQQLYYGTKSMVKGTVSMIKLGMKALKPKIDKIYEGFRGVKKWFGEIKTKLSNWLQDSAKKLGNFGKSLGSFFGFGDASGSGDSVNKENFFTNIMKKFRNTEFGKGFMYAHDERKKLKSEDLLSSTPETKEAAELSRANTTLTSILSAVQAIGEKNGLKFGNKNADGAPNPTGQLTNGAVNAVTNAANNGGTNQPQMADVSTVQNTSSDLGSQSTANPIAGVNAAQQGASAANKLGSTVGSAAGLISGGAMAVISGILKFVMSIVVTLKGFKAVFNLYKKLFQSAFKPLNSFFNYILKEFKPVLKAVRNALKSVMSIVTTLLKGVLEILKPLYEDVIQPLYEALTPALDSIVGILEPIFALLGSLMKVVMIPMLAALKFTIIPIINIIADVLSYIAGAIMVTVGTVESILGGIFQGIGTLISLVGKFTGGSIKEYGTKMIDDGKELSDSGNKYINEGIKLAADSTKKLIADTINFATLGIVDADLGQNDTEAKTGKKIETTSTDTIANTYANGDVSNTWIYNSGSSDIYNTYGGEYQRGMGGYLNMNQRGCGPIALADMYNRRGGHMSARDLASSMYGAGAYDPSRGTSIGSYLSAGRALGMGLHAGTVTQDSLKLASPSNPITVIGSGSDYGTRSGNNHYMNVIGADRHGGAYVSNPLTGRVERKPASTVVGSSVVGIYGSGDYDDDEGYTFPDAIKEAFSELKSQAAKLLGLFTMDDEDEYETQLSEEKNSAAEEQAKRALGDKYEAFAAAAEELGRAKYRELYPQRDGQSDDDYEAAFQKWYKSHSSEFLAKAKVNDMTAGDTAAEIYSSLDSANSDLKADLEKFISNTYANMSGINNSIGSSGGSGRGYFTSDSGVPLWTDAYSDNIEITETDMTKNGYNSPLFEFFAKTMGLKLGDVFGSSWFSKRDNPNTEGVGQSGDSHSGIDFTGGAIHGKPLYATTGGTVVQNSFEANGGGNMLIWKDAAGKLHWYMHMLEPSHLNVGDTIEGGDLIGYVGSTGASTGDHLHYTINDSTWSSGTNAINPLMYFNRWNPAVGQAIGTTDEEKIYSYLTTSGMTPIGAAGLMGCFKYESDMRTNNLENSYNDQFGLSDAEYTNMVNNGTETEDQFVYGRNATAWGGQTPGEAVGYGIAQFTSSNLKRDLYNKTVKSGRSIADIEPQLDAIISVLKERGIYDTINSAKTPTDANKTFLWKYEAGTGYTSDEAVLNAYPWMLNSNPDGTQLRHQYAEAIYERFKDWKPSSAKKFTVNSQSDADLLKKAQTSGSFSGVGTGVVITQSDDLNIRRGMSTNSDIIGTLPSGTEVNIQSTDNRGWLYLPDYDGYVSAEYIRVTSNDTIKTSSNSSGGSGNKSTTKSVNSNADAKGYSEAWSAPTSYNDILPKNDASWKAKWYTDPSYYKYFMSEDNRGNWSPLYTSGRFKTLENMSRLIGKNIGKRPDSAKNEYWQNLKNATGDASRADWLTQQIYDTAFTAEEWKNLRDNYVKHPKTDSTFQDALNYVHMGMYGSGDAAQTMSEDQFWNTYLNWNNNSSNYVAPQSSNSAYDTDTYYDTENGVTVVNNYAVTRGEDRAANARIKAILANTYNVRSESMEALLIQILDELRKRRPTPGPSNTNGSTKLFDEQIPSQVSRLSIG